MIKFGKTAAVLAALLVCSAGIHDADARKVSHHTSSHASRNQIRHVSAPSRTQVRPAATSRNSAPRTAIPAVNQPARTAGGTLVGSAWSLPGRADEGSNLGLLMEPASTMKVLTAAAALTELGRGFRFTTSLKTDAASPDRLSPGGVLNGSLVLEFGGDPTFTSEKLLAMLSRLKEQGIRRIKGDIIVGTGPYSGYTRGTGWPWDDLPLCFAAPAGNVIIDHNCVITKARLGRGSSNFSPAQLTEMQPVRISFSVSPVTRENYNAEECPMIVEPSTSNTYTVSGCFNSEINRRKDYVQDFKFAVQDPNLWARDILRVALRKSGISFTGDVRARDTTGMKLKTLDTNRSAELPVLLKHMLKFSDNLYAEAVAAAAARSFYGRTVSIRSSAQAVKRILQEKGRINFAGADLYDGSGLSSYNLISAGTMLQVLKYIRDNDARLGMIDLLPVSGESGTLLRRASVTTAPLKGRIMAKTGTIRHVRNLAGFVRTENEHLVPFVIYTNAYALESSEYSLMQQENKMLPHFEYERSVLRSLYEEKRPEFR